MASIDEKRASITPMDAMHIALDPLLKQYKTIQLLKPSEFNSAAKTVLQECLGAIVRQIPGAEHKIINEPQVAEAIIYKNQIRQGQTIFATSVTSSTTPTEPEVEPSSRYSK